jgi:hypothetical protein
MPRTKISQSRRTVLFVNVGWAEAYDGCTTIVGKHKYLQVGDNGDDCSEMHMYVREKGKYHCGIGSGKPPPYGFDVVFVAKHPVGNYHQAVGIYRDVHTYESSETDNYWWAQTSRICKLKGSNRTIVKWPKGQGMRRWAHRDKALGRSHPKLYAVYEAILAR